MTAPSWSTVVRRSALEARHRARGARWIGEQALWPVGYGPPDRSGEDIAVAAGSGLAEIGPFDEWLVRGPGAIEAVAARLGSSERAGRVITSPTPGGTEAWLLGPDEVLLLAPVDAGGAAPTILDPEPADLSVIEMTGSRTTLRLAGPTAPAILAELCPVDTTPRTMSQGDLIQAPLASVRAFIVRLDSGDLPGYTIMVARDEAAYVWDAFVDVGRAHGLTPVGPAAVAPAAVAPTAVAPMAPAAPTAAAPSTAPSTARADSGGEP